MSPLWPIGQNNLFLLDYWNLTSVSGFFNFVPGSYMAKNFSSHFLKYGCAFLNSGGGSLLIGVQDNGVVSGLIFNHEKEDRTRLQVDKMLKHFEPPLLPHNYILRFLPVITPGNQQHCLKVLCFTFQVSPAIDEPTLYRVGQDHVYVRRNGSVQGPMGASFILEWSRQVRKPIIILFYSQHYIYMYRTAGKREWE